MEEDLRLECKLAARLLETWVKISFENEFSGLPCSSTNQVYSYILQAAKPQLVAAHTVTKYLLNLGVARSLPRAFVSI